MFHMIRVVGRGVLALAGLLLLLALAWVASNGRWADAAPRPVPAELALRPVQLEPQRNAFFDLQGLNAPPQADANAVGQAELRAPTRGADQPLRWPEGEAWSCRVRDRDCAALWKAQAAALRQDMGKAAVLGARCERIAQAQALEEVLPQRTADGPLADVPFAALPLPRFGGVTACMRWLGMQALLAEDDRRALAWLAQADRLARLALAGSRSLIGTMVSVAAVQSSWLTATDVLAARGQDRAALEPLLAPLPPHALSPRNWIPHEAQFVREVVRDMVDPVHGCHNAVDFAGLPATSWLDRQLCRWALGMLPEQSRQDGDARWLQRLATLPAEGPASCDALQSGPWRERTPWPSWRNTLTRWLLDVPHGQLASYGARQLDLELLRQALLATLHGQPLPAAVDVAERAGVRRFSACQARLAPPDAQVRIRWPA
jgi:hypothetical protein